VTPSRAEFEDWKACKPPEELLQATQKDSHSELGGEYPVERQRIGQVIARITAFRDWESLHSPDI